MKHIALSAVTGLALSATASLAAPFTVDYQDPNDPFGADALYRWVTIDSEVYDGTYRAGQFAFNKNGIDAFLAFCIEVTQGLRDGHTYNSTPTLFDQAVIDNVDRLFSSAYDTVTNGLAAAGFQVALWEIVEDTATTLDLTSGSFSAVDAPNNTGVIATAQGYLDGLASATMGQYNIAFLHSPTSQDVVTVSEVPLPASGLLLLSAGGLLMVRRKRK